MSTAIGPQLARLSEARYEVGETVGTTFVLDNLKKLLLVCNRIACPDVDYFRLPGPNEFGDLAWLTERSIFSRQRLVTALPEEASEEWRAALDSFDLALAERDDLPRELQVLAVADCGALALALQLREGSNLKAYPALHSWATIETQPASATAVLQHVLAALPDPREHTVAAVVQFRDHETSSDGFPLLQYWMQAVVEHKRTEGDVIRALQEAVQRSTSLTLEGRTKRQGFAARMQRRLVRITRGLTRGGAQLQQLSQDDPWWWEPLAMAYVERAHLQFGTPRSPEAS